MANSEWRMEISARRIAGKMIANRYSLFLLNALALAHGPLEQLQIALNVGIFRILGLGLQERDARTRIVAAQNVGIALIVQHLGRRADNADSLGIGPVRELEPAQLVI